MGQGAEGAHGEGAEEQIQRQESARVGRDRQGLEVEAHQDQDREGASAERGHLQGHLPPALGGDQALEAERHGVYAGFLSLHGGGR